MIPSLIPFQVMVEEARGGMISNQEYSEIRDISLTILQKYPPEKYVLIGVGRSPTPFVTFLQNLTASSVYQLPISNFRYNKHQQEGISRSQNQVRSTQPLSEAQKKILFEHLDHFLPSQAIVKGRKMVFVDFSRTAATLIGLSDYVEEYLATKGRPSSIDLLAISQSDYEDAIDGWSYVFKKKVNLLILDENSYVLDTLERGEYDPYAPRGQWFIQDQKVYTPPATLTTRQPFKEELAKRMALDSVVDAYKKTHRSRTIQQIECIVNLLTLEP